MALPKIIFVALIHSLAVATVFGWSHVSRGQFQSFVNENEVVLVACKSPKQVLMRAEVSWLIAVLAVCKPLYVQVRSYMIYANIEPDASAMDVRQFHLQQS
jgi:hypothetical protein